MEIRYDWASEMGNPTMVSVFGTCQTDRVSGKGVALVFLWRLDYLHHPLK